MSGEVTGALRGEHPDHPGWIEYRVGEPQHFNQAVFGLILVRLDDPGTARVRVIPRELHTNLYGAIHGGAVLSLIDISLFVGCAILRGEKFVGAVSLQIDTQFTGAGNPARPLDALVEVVRETGKLAFCRGSVVQEDNVVAAYSGILRKITPR